MQNSAAWLWIGVQGGTPPVPPASGWHETAIADRLGGSARRRSRPPLPLSAPFLSMLARAGRVSLWTPIQRPGTSALSCPHWHDAFMVKPYHEMERLKVGRKRTCELSRIGTSNGNPSSMLNHTLEAGFAFPKSVPVLEFSVSAILMQKLGNVDQLRAGLDGRSGFDASNRRAGESWMRAGVH